MQLKNSKQISTLIFIIALALFASGSFGRAAEVDVDQLKFQKNQLQEKLDSINKQIQSFQGQIADTQKKQASLKNEIFIYDRQIKSTELSIDAKQTQIDEANLQIKELQLQIDRRVAEINKNKLVLKELLVQLHELGGSSFLRLALGTKDFSSFLDQVEHTNTAQDKIYQIVKNIKTVKAKLEEQQVELRGQVSKLEGLLEELKTTRAGLAAQERDKQNLLDKTRGVERNYQKLLSSSKTEEANLQKEMEDLDAQVRAKLGQRTVTAKKGSLSMPMRGIITQSYGKTGFTALGYNYHNGIDVAAPAGAPIYAAADGKVNACDMGEASYGNWCSVKHNILTNSGSVCVITLYAHMRSIKAKVGQEVKEGDIIGYEGNTGNTTRLLYGPERGYHLHFTVFDCEGFGIAQGKHSKVYGPYTVPYGYTYNPRDFLP